MRRLKLGGPGETRRAESAQPRLRTCERRSTRVKAGPACASSAERSPPSRPRSSARCSRPRTSRPRAPRRSRPTSRPSSTPYLSDEREVNERAKDILSARQGPTDFDRVRALAADEKGIKVGDDTLDYLLDQVVEMLMHSNNVDEVFVEDLELRRQAWRPSSRSTWRSTRRSTPRCARSCATSARGRASGTSSTRACPRASEAQEGPLGSVDAARSRCSLESNGRSVRGACAA